MADKTLSVLLNASETISKSLAKVAKSFGSTERDGKSLARSLQTITAASQPAQKALGNTGDKARSAGRGISRAGRAMSKATPSAIMYAGAVDEVGDEALEAATKNTTLAAAVNAADLSFGNMTVNIGAIGVALKNLHTQIPILVTVLGTLIGSLYGVAAASIAAAGAIGMIFGGGALALGQQYADTMEDVEGAMEGIAEVMKVVGSMFQEAMEPLMDQTSIDYFIEGMEGLANTLARVAGWIRSIRDDFMDFGRTIGAIFTDELPRVLGAFEESFLRLRPILEDIMRFFMVELADSINYFTDMIIQIEDELRQFIDVLLEFLRATHELGVVAMLQGAMPVFLEVIEGITELIDMVNDLDDELVSGIGRIIGMVLALKLLSGAVGAVFGPLSKLGGALHRSFIGVSAIQGLKNLSTEMLALSGAVFPGFTVAAKGVKDAISTIGSSLVGARSSIAGFKDSWYALRTSFFAVSTYNPADNIAALGMASSGAADAAGDLQRAISGASLGNFSDEAIEAAKAAGGLRGAVVQLGDDFAQLMFDARELGFVGAFRQAMNNVEVPDRLISSMDELYDSTVMATRGFIDMYKAGRAGDTIAVLDETIGRFRTMDGMFASWDTPNILPSIGEPRFIERIGYQLGELRTRADDVAASFADMLTGTSIGDIFSFDGDLSIFDRLRGKLDSIRSRASDVAIDLAAAFRDPIGSAQALASVIVDTLIPAKLSDAAATFKETLASKGLATALVSTLIPARLSDAYATFTETYANQGLVAALTGAAQSAWRGVASFGSLAAAKLSDAAASFTNTMANAGLGAALTGLLAPLWAVVAGLWAKVSAALAGVASVAALAVTTAIAAGPMGLLALAAGAFSAALGGLPLILGAIILGMGALVGIIGNAKGEFGGFGGIISAVKTVLAGLADLILRAFIPVWNAMVSLFMIVWKPLDAIVSGLLSVGHALGIVSEDTNDSKSLLKALFGLLGPLADAFGAVFKVIDMILRPIGTLLALPIKAFFWVLATAIKVVLFPFRALIAVIKFFLNLLWDVITLIPGMETALRGIADVIGFLIGAITNFGDTWDMIWDGAVNAVASALELIAPMINRLIGWFNKIPGVDIEKIDTQEIKAAISGAGEEEKDNGLRVAREDFAKEAEEEDPDNIASVPNPDISFQEHHEQNINGDMNMLPEEKERVKKLVSDALDEANTYRRKRQGHSG